MARSSAMSVGSVMSVLTPGLSDGGGICNVSAKMVVCRRFMAYVVGWCCGRKWLRSLGTRNEGSVDWSESVFSGHLL